jgi:hypothetical protein
MPTSKTSHSSLDEPKREKMYRWRLVSGNSTIGISTAALSITVGDTAFTLNTSKVMS